MVSAIFMASVLAVSGSGDVTLLQFTADWCGACQSVKPAVKRLVDAGYPVREVNVDREQALAAQFRVTSIPCFVLLVNGREVERVTEASSYARLVQMFERANAPAIAQSSAEHQPATVRGQSEGGARLPRPLAAFARNFGNRREAAPAEPLVQIESPSVAVAPSAPASSPPSKPAAIPPAAPSEFSMAAVRPEPQPISTPSFEAAVPQRLTEQDLHAHAVRATVRLRIDDLHGHSVGTGTIIDTRQNEALIVTCGHVFRDSNGKGKIAVDLFAKEQVQTVNGTLISYDLERDLGFVAIPLDFDITPVKVAPTGFPIQRGQSVFSVGCDRGADPSVRPSRITGVDRYVGPPNIEVLGQPAEGRSGGGLFSSDGYLIGVCNAGDPKDNEGIYAALPAIHWELERIGQREIFARNENSLAAANQVAPTHTDALVPVNTEATPGRMTQQPPRAQIAIAPSPVAASAPIDTRTDVQTEVICIVRSRNNPQGEQLFILEQPSQDLLNRLASESRAQSMTPLARDSRVPSNIVRAQGE